MSDQDGHQVLTYPQAVDALRSITAQIRRLEDELAAAITEHADSEAAYRSQFAFQLRKHRDEGLAMEHAVAAARAEISVLDRDRIKAEHRIKLTLERLEDRRGERASLNALVRWASRAGGGDE